MDNSGGEAEASAAPNILIVEDEWLVAIDLQDAVESNGYQTVGPAHSVSAALELIEAKTVDGGLLDVNLRGETSYPIADALSARGIPFAFISGYTSDQLRPEFQERPLLSKPINFATLPEQLIQLLRPK